MAPHGDLPPNQQRDDFIGSLRGVLSPEALAAIETWAQDSLVDGDREALGLPRRLSALEEAFDKALPRVQNLENNIPNNAYRRKVDDGHHHYQPVEGMDDQVSQGYGFQLDVINGIKLTRGSWPLNRRLTIDGTGGIGPFEFDHIVDADFAAVVSAGDGTEGMQLTTLHGHTFKVWSVIQSAVDDWVANTGEQSILVVPGNYAEDVSIEEHLSDVGSGVHRLTLTTPPGNLTQLTSLTVAGKFWSVNPNYPSSRIENFRLTGDLNIGSTNDRDVSGVGFFNMNVSGNFVFKSDTSVLNVDHLTFNHCVFGTMDDNSIVVTIDLSRFISCSFNGRVSLSHRAGSSASRISSTTFADCSFRGGMQVRGIDAPDTSAMFSNCYFRGGLTEPCFDLISSGAAAPPDYDNLSFAGCYFEYRDHNAEWAFIKIGIAGTPNSLFVNLAITGCTFQVPGLAADEPPIHILWAPSSGATQLVHVAFVGNSFLEDSLGNRIEDLSTTSRSYSVKGYFERSVFGPNCPADFEVELLGGTKNLYVGTGLIVGTGITPVTGFFEDSYNGTIIQPITFVVTSDGATITGTLDANPSGDMTQRFSDGYTTLTSGATVTLTAGSAIAPQKNYIYILQSDKSTLVANTSDWPNAEHCQIAEVIVQTAALVQSDGVLANRNWNNMTKGTDGQGHHTHAWERLRWEHSAYKSGSAVTWSGSGTAALDLAITAGKVYQLHIQDVSAFDTTDPDSILVPNHATAYTATADIETLVLDSAGGSLSGRYYNLVIWCSVSSASEKERVFINLPGGSYNKEADATADVGGFDNYTIPTDFRGYAYLIERVTIKHSPAAGGTWTIGTRVDLRGQVPNVVAGGGTAAITTEFADNQFKIFDDGDPTKVLAFQASGISASTTRTITVPDADITLLDDTGAFPTGWSDTSITGAELETLSDGSDADALHNHPSDLTPAEHTAIGDGAPHHAEAHTIASHSDTTATGAELETLTDGSDADALHTHPAAVSEHTYIFVPDAAKGADIATGDQQGIPHHSGDQEETVTAVYLDSETAPTGADMIIEIEYGNTDDLDTVASWTRIDLVTLAAGSKSVKDSTPTDATLPANRLIRMNVDQVGSTVAGADGAVHMKVKRKLTT